MLFPNLGSLDFLRIALFSFFHSIPLPLPFLAALPPSFPLPPFLTSPSPPPSSLLHLSPPSLFSRDEQRDYFSRTASWADVHPSQLVGPPVLLKSYDLLTVSLEELKQDLHASFSMRLPQACDIEAFCGYFDVQFRGSEANPTDSPVTLSTAPDATGATHWGQQVFFLHPAVTCAAGDQLDGTLDMSRRSDNHRLMDVKIDFEKTGGEKRNCRFHIE